MYPQIEQLVTPVFFTLNNQNGERNPRSVIVLEGMYKLGQEVVVLDMLGACEMISAALVLLDDVHPRSEEKSRIPVALFDSNQKVNHWHPQLNADRFTPDWARATEWGVRIGAGGVASPARIECCATQIVALFARPLVISETERPWGPARKSYREKKPRRLRLRREGYSQSMHLW